MSENKETNGPVAKVFGAAVGCVFVLGLIVALVLLSIGGSIVVIEYAMRVLG